ncbi:hypothetical protein J1N35_040443 [Gossypium stocksii]|uniref:Membrane-associated kinase regulator 4 n=1 Tax=Gossypium stocksii TaxID=47602 RepID=A0A9D3UDP8_9ROSI|nr:hypothetical protein J1N35_040443 [Gossypium stocksii]
MAALSHFSNNLEEGEGEGEEEEEDEYIDMEVSSRSKNMVSNPITREFEFQMSSVSIEKEPTNSPADELFYKGKLLPLHLPPRLQMVQKLLQNSITEPHKKDISPSSEPSGDQLEHSNGGSGENPKKSWTKKLKLMKQSSIGSKLKKASRVYLRYLFGNYKSTKKAPLEQDMNGNGHRRSFSMASKRHSSGSSNGQQHLLVLKRSSSVNAEMESPIQGAIAHCKQSQQAWVRSRRTVSEVGVFSFSASDMKCSW